MFACCCPKQKQDIRAQLVNNQEQYSPTERRNTELTNKNVPNQGIEPSFQSQPPPRNFYKDYKDTYNEKEEQVEPKPIIFQKKGKSDLWRIENQSELVYYNFKDGTQIFLTFIVHKRKGSSNNPSLIEHIIKKSDEGLAMVVPCSMSMFFHEGSHSNINNINVIFGSMNKGIQRKLSKDDDSISVKSNSGYFDHRAGQTIEIKNLSQIRTSAVDSFYISVENEVDKDYLKDFCIRTTELLNLEDLQKVSYVFPCFMSLDDIAEVVFANLRKFLIKETLQKIANMLIFEIQFMETSNGNNLMIVSKKNSKQKKTPTSAERPFINPGIGLLMLELADCNYRIYSTVINSIKNEKLAEYLLIKMQLDEVRNDKERFFQKLSHLRLLSAEDIGYMQRQCNSFKKINPIKCQPHRAAFQVSAQLKERIGRIVQGYNSPGLDNTPVKKEWDDDLKSSDIPVPPAKNENEPMSVDLEILRDSDISDVDLDQIDPNEGESLKVSGPQFQLQNEEGD